jgi:hypothetical protein
MIYGAIIGVILLDIGSLVVIRRRRSRLRSSGALRRLRRLLWVVGIVLAVASVIFPWPYDTKTRILGFPIPGVVFELWTNSKGESFWADFVGPLSLPVLGVDFVLCVFLPQVVLAVVLIVRSERRPATRQADTAEGLEPPPSGGLPGE